MNPTSDTDEAQSTLLARMAAGASIVVHLAAVALSLGYAGAGLFASEPEAVPVEVVSDQEVPPPPSEKQPADEKKQAPDKLDLRPALDNTQTQQAQQQSPPQPPAAQAATQRQAALTPAPAQQQKQPTAQPAYTPPAPDISMRYQIDLGLKPLPMAAAPQVNAARNGNSEFDDAATSNANIGRASIAAFRAHLKQCATLPAAVGPDDKVVIVLRATFTPDAKLAAAPVLIEASASSKGPALMQAAIAALQSCQPYVDLPADKYAEWRVLDLRFTPQDFRRG